MIATMSERAYSARSNGKIEHPTPKSIATAVWLATLKTA